MSDSIQKTENTAADKAQIGADAPATEKQKAYVEVLAKKTDVEVEELGMTRGQASEKIEALKNGEAPAESKKRSASEKDTTESKDDSKDEKMNGEQDSAKDAGKEELDGEPKAKKAKVAEKAKPNGEAGDEAKFQNSEKDEKETGGAVEATNKQAAFIDSLREQAGEEHSKAAADEHMTRNEASDEINKLKPQADQAQPSALEADKTPAPGSHLAHPEKWATGEEPATTKQKNYIAVLEKQTGESVDAGTGLSKADASEKIEELKGSK